MKRFQRKRQSVPVLGRTLARYCRLGRDAEFRVPPTSIHRVEADGVRVFYRAAGDPAAPALLLLQGFPASSFMFRELIPRLAEDYLVIAPDLPGFGFTEVPAERKYVYSFYRLASTMEAFTQALRLNRYAIYVFDYGAPTGFRLAMAHPEGNSLYLGPDPSGPGAEGTDKVDSTSPFGVATRISHEKASELYSG